MCGDLQLRGDLRLTLETAHQVIAPVTRRDVVANELDRRGTDEESVPGEPDLAHPTRTKRRDQAIAADTQRFAQLLLVHVEHGALAEEDGAFQHRSQLADVSGPGVALKPAHRVGRDAVDHLPEPPCVTTNEMIDERRYVLPPIDERRHADAVLGERLKQRQEPALRRLTPILRRRGNQPHVRDARLTARWLASTAFQRRVESALKVWRQVVHRIEKQRAARCQIESARDERLFQIV